MTITELLGPPPKEDEAQRFSAPNPDLPSVTDLLGPPPASEPQKPTVAQLLGPPPRIPTTAGTEVKPVGQSDWKDGRNAFTGGVADSAAAIPQGMYSQAAKTIVRPSAIINSPLELTQQRGRVAAELDAIKSEAPNLTEMREAMKRGEARQASERWEAEKQARISAKEAELSAIDSKVNANTGETAQAISDEYQSAADALGENRKMMSEFYNVDKDFQESFGGKLIAGAGQMVPQVVAGSLGGIGLAALQSQAFQYSWDDAVETAKRNGEAFDPNKAYAFAFTNSLQQAILERAGIDAALGRWMKEGGEATIKEGLKRIATGAVGEGATETTQGAVSDQLASSMDVEQRNPLDLGNRAEDFALGSALGGPLAGVHYAASAADRRGENVPESSPDPQPQDQQVAPEIAQMPTATASAMDSLPPGFEIDPQPTEQQEEIERLIAEDVERKRSEYDREEFEPEPAANAALPPGFEIEGDSRYMPKDVMASGWDSINSSPDITPDELANELTTIPEPDIMGIDETDRNVPLIGPRAEQSISRLNDSLRNAGVGWRAHSVTPDDVHRTQRAPAASLAREIAALFGRRVVVFNSDSAGAPNALVHKSPELREVIFLNNLATKPHMLLMGHELYHHIELSSPQLAAQVRSELEPLIRNKDAVNSNKADYPEERRFHEVAGDLFGDSMADPKFWEGLNDRNPSAFQKVASIVRRWLARIADILRKRGFGSSQYFSDIERARAVVANALDQFSRKPFGDSKMPPMEPQDNSPGLYASGAPSASPIDRPNIRPFVKFPISSATTMKKKVWSLSRPAFDFQRFYMGTADILAREPKLRFLSKAIRKHVDTQRKYAGEMTAPFRKWMQKHNQKARRQALKEFEGYFRENDRNEPLARKIYSVSSPAGQQLIDTWKEVANDINTINQTNDVMVWDSEKKELRPIGRVANYFPRMLNPRTLEILANPAKNKDGYDELAREMVAEGLIKDPSEAAKYLDKVVNSRKANDRFGSIESARALPLPNNAYDYSFETVQRYIASWTERIAQIEAFGQKLHGHNAGKDVFDLAQELAGDERTKTYIKLVQDRAYNVRWESGWAPLVGGMNTLATGLQLGNPMSALKNLISGTAFTAQAYGARRTLKAMGSIIKDWNQINDAFEKGLLLDDLMNIMQDGQAMGVKEGGKLQKFTQGALKWSGFNSAETFVRGVNMVAARAALRDAIKANEKNPLSSRSLRYRNFFARLGVRSPEALLAEGGSGELTNQYLRAAVNEIQGGYRYDQVPVFMDSPAGKFLLKYQKWGSQQLRHFDRNVLHPFLQATSGGKIGRKEFVKARDPKTGAVVTKQVPGEVMPMARYAIFLALAGAGIEEVLGLLFGVPEREASWSEIMAAFDKDTAEGFGKLMSKMWGYHLMAGSLGALGNYAQMGMDFTQRSRFKNPVDPPGISPLKGVGNILLDLFEQGTLTPKNVDDLLRQQVSAYRTTKQVAARLNDVFGTDFRPLELETNRQSLQWLRGVTLRYNQTLGVRSNKTQFGRIGKNEQSPFRTALREDLLLGDTKAARQRLREHFKGMAPERQKVEMAGLMASIRATQPIKAGYGSEAMRQNFLDWAKKNLSKEEVARIAQVDQTYRKAAISLGLMKPEKDISDEDLTEAMRKIEIRAK